MIYTYSGGLIWLQKFEVLSLPIPLRILFAAQPQLLAPLLQVTHRVIAGLLVKGGL